jgi:hypothetical protein
MAPEDMISALSLEDIPEDPDFQPPEKGRFQLKSLSHTHDMVINWMLLNPDRSLRECADYFGYSQPWLSTLIHTDLFQARLKERQAVVFAQIAQTVPEKLTALSDIATEKLTEAITKSEDSKFILDAFDKVMHRAGYAPASQKNPAGPGVQVTNVFTVDKETLAQARQGMFALGQTVDVTPVTEVKQVEEVPADAASSAP